MKIQSLAVVFAIIILPVTIILSFFIQKEVDTIALQTSYDTKLIDSTHDAMAAFEINTANEDLSSVADSLRSIIEASTNVFFNSLATNLGMSNANKEYLQSFVPAILYTLYDGYYIYSPTRVPQVATYQQEEIMYIGDQGVTYKDTITDASGKKVGRYKIDESKYKLPETEAAKNSRQNSLYASIANKYEYGQMLYQNKPLSGGEITYSPELNENTAYKEDYILKSYMPYTARYTGTDFDVTINYTLDNYITVEGQLGDAFYSKTGYLIARNTVKSAVTKNGGSVVIGDLVSYNETDIEETCLGGQFELEAVIEPIMEDGNRASPITITYVPYEDNGKFLSYVQLKEKLRKLYENADSNIALIQELESRVANMSAITYYAKAQSFSNWVFDNLGMIRVNNIAPEIANYNTGYTTTSETDLFVDFTHDDAIIFNDSINPEQEDSPFVSHKLNVIKNSIQYNLNLALSSYNRMAGGLNFQMPALQENEWMGILTRVSVVSFMQGLNCGLKTYNNYAIISSTNNELTVIPTEIYYTNKNEYNTANVQHLYHRIDCEKLNNGGEYLSFRSKEAKYDKIYDKTIGTAGAYRYDHRNNACYRCIVGGNYTKQIDSVGTIGYSDNIYISLLSPEKRKAYYVAVGKERQNIYKTNALTDSNGYEIMQVVSTAQSGMTFARNSIDILSNETSRPLKDIREILVTVRDMNCLNKSEATVNFQATVNGEATSANIVLNLQQSTPQTFAIPVHSSSDAKLNNLGIQKVDLDDDITCKVLSIQVIYE